MKKRILQYFLIALVVFLAPFYSVKAEEVKIGNITANAVRVRSGPGTNYQIYSHVNTGYSFYVLDEKPNEGGCDAPWYKLKFDNKNAYVCSEFVNVRIVIPENYQAEFPKSYQKLLEDLQEKYPSWTFVPYQTGIKFSDAIAGQDFLRGNIAKSLINDFRKNRDGLKHLDSFDYKTNSFFNGYSGGGSNWYAASPETLAYYLDPRNFLNEQRIFMFEQLSFEPNFHHADAVQLMLNNTFMSGKATQTKADRDRGLTYAEIFIEAAKEHNVNPYFLAARVIQEVGHNRSVIVSGTVSGFEGYYNFYNIGATGPQNEIISRGLTRAKNEGWNNEYDAIVDGARFITRNYIGRGQDTLYFQKYNVVTPTYFANQYMQNVEAPYHEAFRVFRNYRDNNLLEQPLVFRIPIYDDMPSENKLPHSGNPNNYLKSLKIDNKSVSDFSPEKYSYEVTVSGGKVNLKADVFANTASISGLGEIVLDKEKTKHQVVVTAENKTTRTYEILFTRIDAGDLSVTELVSRAKLENSNQFLKKIELGERVSNFKDRFARHSFSAEVTVKDVDGKVKNSGRLSTGDVVIIKNGADEQEYKVVINGDVTGNGQIGLLDLVRVRRHLLGAASLSEEFKEAADMNGDGKIGLIDLIRIQRIIIDS